MDFKETILRQKYTPKLGMTAVFSSRKMWVNYGDHSI